jgi:hypothetical protein
VTEAAAGARIWAAGTWTGCVEHITGFVGDEPLGVALARLEQALESLPSRGKSAEQRRERFHLIARRCQTEAGRALNRYEAEQDDRLGEAIVAVGQIARLLCGPPVDKRVGALLQSQIALIRAVASEELQAVYAIADQADAAHHIAMALVVLAAQDGRFDDYRLSVMFGNIHSESHQGDWDKYYAYRIASLRYLASSQAVSEVEAESRARDVSYLVEALAPDRVVLSAELREFVDGARELAFVVETFPLSYQDTVARLLELHNRTRSIDYLVELRTFCADAWTEENEYQAALRKTDHAQCVWQLGVARADPYEMLDAVGLQMKAALEGHPTDPHIVHYRTLAAANWFGLVLRRGQPVSPVLARLTALLPSLPPEKQQPDQYVAAGYLLRAAIELQCAHEQVDDDSTAAQSLFSNVVASCDAARALCTDSQRDTVLPSAQATKICANVALALARGESPAPSHVQDLLTYVSDPDNDPLVYGLATRLALELAADPATRRQLLAAPAPNDGAQHRLGEDYAGNVVAFWLMRAALAVGQGQLRAPEAEVREHAQLLVGIVLGAAATLARHGSVTITGNTELSSAILLARTAALDLLAAGDVAAGAELLQSSSSLIGLASRFRYSVDPVMRDAIQAESQRLSDSTGVIVVADEESMAVLTRERGREWLAHTCDDPGAIMALSSADWPSLTESGGLFTLMDRIDKVASAVRALSAAHIVSDGPVPAGAVLVAICGEHLILPPALLSLAGCDPEVPTMLVAGMLTDSAREAALQPLSPDARIAFLVGREELLGGDLIDVQRDIDAVMATGLKLTMVGTEFDAIQSVFSGASVIHYSGHLFRDNPNDTALLFADGSRLSLDRIRALEISETQIVTLIGCESGAETSAGIEEMAHVAGAFLDAGVGLVIASLWPVFDTPAHLFVEAFYSGISRGLTIWDSYRRGVDAIRLHRNGSINPYAHPVFWASFTMFAGSGTWEAAAAHNTLTARADRTTARG